MTAIKCDVCGGFFAYGEVSHPDCKPPSRRRALVPDDIPVSKAMIEAGWQWVNRDLEAGWTEALIELYRAMERVRRAEADAEVIRRSVKDG